MILSDKIITLRKKQGWSQEELANQLNVSRQAVSKWESAASIPELDKIVKMSSLFGVSTDYLLIDDLEEVQYAEYDEPVIRKIDLVTANSYIELAKTAYRKIALGVMLCILSPIVLLCFNNYRELNPNPAAENVETAIGLAVLFALVFISVILFITNGLKLAKFNYLEKEPFDLEYGVKGVLQKHYETANEILNSKIVISVSIIFIAVIQLIIGAMLVESISVYLTAILLGLVSIAVYILVYYGSIKTSYSKLLQQDDFTPTAKENQKKTEPFDGAFWMIVTAIYLLWSFSGMKWGITWIVWPIAGLVFAAIKSVISRD